MIQATNIHKYYGDLQVLKGVDIHIKKSEVVSIVGASGAGKTTLIKAIVKELGGDGDVSSPTFGIVNQYQKSDGALLGYHFDFYRLNNESEALDFGLEDYLYSNGWIFMEWPEKVESLLPNDVAHIYLQLIDSTTRSIIVENN